MKNPDFLGEILSCESTNVFNDKQLEQIRQQLIETYGEDYGQAVYEQEYLVSFDAANIGSILGRALSKAERDGRIDNLHDYDPEGAPVEISSDIGRRDASSWWFWQPCLGGFRIIDHDVDSGLDAYEWTERLNTKLYHATKNPKGYKLRKIWLPHDARNKTFSAKHTAVEIFLAAFSANHVGIVPDAKKPDRYNAARRVITKCAFHRDKTEKGRDGLANWCFLYDEERREFSKEADHNWASHDGDGFSYGALIMEEVQEKTEKEEKGRIVSVFENTATLNDMWKTPQERHTRI